MLLMLPLAPFSKLPTGYIYKREADRMFFIHNGPMLIKETTTALPCRVFDGLGYAGRMTEEWAFTVRGTPIAATEDQRAACEKTESV